MNATIENERKKNKYRKMEGKEKKTGIENQNKQKRFQIKKNRKV